MLEKYRTCAREGCGKVFFVYHRSLKVCSDECREIYNQAVKNEYSRKRYKKYKEQAKALKEKGEREFVRVDPNAPRPKLNLLVCATCERQFFDSMPHRKTCCESCKRSYDQKNALANYHKKEMEKLEFPELYNPRKYNKQIKNMDGVGLTSDEYSSERYGKDENGQSWSDRNISGDSM